MGSGSGLSPAHEKEASRQSRGALAGVQPLTCLFWALSVANEALLPLLCAFVLRFQQLLFLCPASGVLVARSLPHPFSNQARVKFLLTQALEGWRASVGEPC